VWTAWGSPAPYAAAVHAVGGTLLHTVGSLDEARTAVAEGADVLVAQGAEAGGHVRGRLLARELLRQLRDALPSVVAGGDAAVLGTRFQCSPEADVSPLYRQAVLAAGPGDTVLAELFDKGWPGALHRVLRNSTVRMWAAAGCPPPGSRPGERDMVAHRGGGTPVERYADVIPIGEIIGDLEAFALYAGEPPRSSRTFSQRPTLSIGSFRAPLTYSAPAKAARSCSYDAPATAPR